MENSQSLSNIQSTETAAQQETTQKSRKLFVAVIASILFVGIFIGSIVYFFQKSANDRVVNGLEQKITSLEQQILTMKQADVETELVGGIPSVTISSEPLQDSQKSSQTITLPSSNGAMLSEIKYTLPDGWEAKIRPDQNDLFVSPKEEGGYLAIKVYAYDGKTGRRGYYCQLTKFCIDATYFTSVKIGNISGYKANTLDNSGGGPEYFGAKGDKFYIISIFSPSYPPDNYFDRTYQKVLDSLVF